MSSIIEESKKARGFGNILNGGKKKIITISLVVTILGGGSYMYFGGNEDTNKEVVEKKSFTVKKQDLQVAIESDGKVVAKDGVELSFSVSGDTLEVNEVFITEGQKVTKGDKIASVKTADLEYDLNRAYTTYQSALANYNDKIEGATEEEKSKSRALIEQAEISLEQSKISLEKLKLSIKDKIKNAEKVINDTKEDLDKNSDIATSEDVSDAYDKLVDTIKAILINLENILPESDEILGKDNETINNDFENVLGVKDMKTKTNAEGSYTLAKNAKTDLNTHAITLSHDSQYFDIDTAAEKTKKTLDIFEDHLYAMQALLDASITSSDLSQTQLDSFKSTINNNRTTINSKITSIRNDIKTVEDAKSDINDYLEDYQYALDALEDIKTDNEQDIANAESNIKARELSLVQAKNSYNYLIAPLTAAELASIKTSLTTASINVEKARNDLDKAIITSPIDGEVAMLNYMPGDIILKDDVKPVVTIINNDTLFIEVNIEEADINKIKVGQKAYATFDALDGLKLDGEISFISLTSKTDNSGIVTYLVRIIINNTTDAQIREGMTTFVDFITAEAKDVLIVPVAAVKNVAGKPSVQMENKEWRTVVTGFTDGKSVEVISGLENGEKVVY